MNMTLDTVPEIARVVLERAHSVLSDQATVIALRGDLGAGKTTLVQSLSRLLSVNEQVISPTFVIMKRYTVIDTLFTHLVHIDAYRLRKSDELLALGWDALCADRSNLIVVEWSEHVPECIPPQALTLMLSHVDDTTRSAEFIA